MKRQCKWHGTCVSHSWVRHKEFMYVTHTHTHVHKHILTPPAAIPPISCSHQAMSKGMFVEVAEVDGKLFMHFGGFATSKGEEKKEMVQMDEPHTCTHIHSQTHGVSLALSLFFSFSLSLSLSLSLSPLLSLSLLISLAAFSLTCTPHTHAHTSNVYISFLVSFL